MATTSPDTLWSPDPTGNYNLVADWATSMQSVQAALVKRANLYVGTSAQRTAFTTAPEGVHWQDTNGDKLEYVRKSGDWEADYAQEGTVTIGSVAGGTTSDTTVTFPRPFKRLPYVVPRITTLQNVAAYHVPTSVSTTGFTFRTRNTGGGAITPGVTGWVAVGVI